MRNVIILGSAFLLLACESSSGSGDNAGTTGSGGSDTAVAGSDTAATTGGTPDAGSTGGTGDAGGTTGDSGGSSCGVEPKLSSITGVYFKISCAFSSCHAPPTNAGGLDLSAAAAHASLVGVSATDPKAKAAGKVRVVAGSPDTSFLVEKLEGPPPGMGSLMPQGVTQPLDPACRIKAVRDWIASGALDN